LSGWIESEWIGKTIVFGFLAGSFTSGRNENTKTEIEIRMSLVVFESTQRETLGAYIRVSRRTIGMFFQFIPESVEITTGTSVSSNVVKWISDPEGRGCDVGLQHAPRLVGRNNKIVFDGVVCFNTIFKENVMTGGMVADVLLDS
jgi:hypothetical protein